ncbi:MAG: hypothetical protein JW881_07455 [Spirochaetales bacterium]|nr:hypothetical protein [Spirochaetales bacterium]
MKKILFLIIIIVSISLLTCDTDSFMSPYITWHPQLITRTIGNGSANLPMTVRFSSRTDVSQVSIGADPGLAPYILVDSGHMAMIHRDATYEFSVTFRIPGGSAEGKYTGTIYVCENGKKIDGCLPIEITVDYGDIVISGRVRQLSDSTVLDLESMSEDRSQIIFSKNSAELDGLAAGDIIVFGITPKTPFGLMRKITSITKTGKVSFDTEQALLEEVILSGSIKINEPILSLDNTIPLRKARSRDIGGEETIYFPVKGVVLYDHDGDHSTTYDQVRLNISVWLTLGYNLELDILEAIDKGEIDYAKFLTYGSIRGEFEIETTFEKEFLDVEIPVSDCFDLAELINLLKGWHLPTLPSIPIPVPVGGVVLVFAISPFFDVGADGTVFAGLKTGASVELKAELGCEYEKSVGWRPIQDVTITPSFNPPRLSAGVNIEAFFDFGVSTQFMPLYPVEFGVDVGPALKLRAFVELDADIFADPWWELFHGLSVVRCFKVGVPFFSLIDWEEPDPFTVKRLLARADGPFFTPGPTPGSSPVPTAAPTQAGTEEPAMTPAPTAAPDHRPDLVPLDITFDASSLAAGNTVSFDSGVRNSGDADSAVFNIAWYVDGTRAGYGGHETVPAHNIVLNGNSAFSWTAAAGTHTLTFTVDVDGNVPESNENNNSTSVTVTVSGTTTSEPTGTPEVTAAPTVTPVPPVTGSIVVDDGDAEFTLSGPSAYWHRETSGSYFYDGDMYWTYANGNEVSNSARWVPNLPAAGNYKVEVFIPYDNATTGSARYLISFQYSSTTMVVNQNIYYDQWVNLGTYPFNAGTYGYVELTDATGEDPYVSLIKIGFDAMRWTRQ